MASSSDTPDEGNPYESEFEKQADQAPIGFFQEFYEFLKYNKKWWLVPIILWLVIIGGLVILSGSPVAPFIYTVF